MAYNKTCLSVYGSCFRNQAMSLSSGPIQLHPLPAMVSAAVIVFCEIQCVILSNPSAASGVAGLFV